MKLGQQDFHFPKPHKRIAAYNGHVERPVFSHQIQHSCYEGITSKVAQAAQVHTLPKVPVFVGITAWAAKRTFSRDFNRERRVPPGKDPSPSP